MVHLTGRNLNTIQCNYNMLQKVKSLFLMKTNKITLELSKKMQVKGLFLSVNMKNKIIDRT